MKKIKGKEEWPQKNSIINKQNRNKRKKIYSKKVIILIIEIIVREKLEEKKFDFMQRNVKNL